VKIYQATWNKGFENKIDKCFSQDGLRLNEKGTMWRVQAD